MLPTAARAGMLDVSVRRPDPRVWRHALHLARGDHRLLEVQHDGAVVVRNNAVR